MVAHQQEDGKLNDEDEVCGCGSFDEAIETAMKAVEDAYLVPGDDHMCLMYQMMVTQAVGAICLRGLHMQLNKICEQKGEDRSEDETREVVLNATQNLQRHLGRHMTAQGSELDKRLVAMFQKKKDNPVFDMTEERSVH